jgi:opacity protein-like surface antigen
MSYKSYISAATASLFAAAFMLVSATGAMAGEEKSYVGPTLSPGFGVTLFGVAAKFPVAENISARPFFQFGSLSGVNLSLYGASATYDFKIPNSEFKPYAGLGLVGASVSAAGSSFSSAASGLYLELGTDYAVSDSIVLNAAYRGGLLSIGAGYQF